MGGHRRFCRIVLLRPPVALAWRADVGSAALGDLWHSDRCIAGHCRQCAGIFRSCMDYASQVVRGWLSAAAAIQQCRALAAVGNGLAITDPVESHQL